jgi:hypothetical protein
MKTKLENNLDQIFDVAQSPSIAEVSAPKEVAPTPTPVDVNPRDGDIDSDYRYARENLYSIIENGSNALDTLVAIANASESPRAFEVVGSLIKTLTDANKDLLDIQNKVKKLKEETGKNETNNVTNALFVGSTAELQKLMKKD